MDNSNTETKKIERKKGRPSKAEKTAPLNPYPGPSIDEVLGWDDAKVKEEFDALNIEPRKHIWLECDESNWSMFGEATLEEPLEGFSPAAVAKLKPKVDKSYAFMQRVELAYALIFDWCQSIRHGDLLKHLQAMTGQPMSESKIRYSEVAKVQRELADLIYAEAVGKSEKMPKTENIEQPSNRGAKKGKRPSTMNA